MTLKRRLSTLEAGGNESLTVFASVPLNWTQDQAAQQVRSKAIANGIKPPFSIVPIHKPDIDGVTIDGVGSLDELFAHVAKHGKRIGRQRKAP